MRLNYLKVVFSGFLSGLALPYFYCLPFLIFGTYYFLKILTDEESHFKCFLLGCFFGFGYSLVGFHWIIFPFFFDEKYKLLIPFILILFPVLMGSFYGLVGFVVSLYNKNTNLLMRNFYFTHTFILSLIIFTCEFLRSHIFGGFPWNLSAHIWSFSHLFISPAKVIGAHGLSFLTIYWITLICVFFYLKKYKTSMSFSLLFPVLIFLYGLSNQNNLNDNSLKVRVVQPSIPQKLKWSPNHQKQNFEKLISLSTIYSDKTKKPEIIIWPESAIPYYLNQSPEIVQSVSEKLFSNTYLITGSLKRQTIDDDVKIYNSLYVIKDGAIVESYDKIKLVPFGEFIPLRSFLPFEKMTSGSTDFSTGLERKVFNIKLLGRKEISIEPSICYEGIFPVKDIVNFRPDFLINITNDAWFGKTTGPTQHLIANRFRAVERGIPLVRVANNGISAIIDNNGKIIKNIDLDKSDYFDVDLKVGFSETYYSKFGNLSLIFMISFILFFSFVADKLIIFIRKE